MKHALQCGLLRLRLLAIRMGRRRMFSVCALLAVASLGLLAGSGGESPSIRSATSASGNGGRFSNLSSHSPMTSRDGSDEDADDDDDDGDNNNSHTVGAASKSEIDARSKKSDKDNEIFDDDDKIGDEKGMSGDSLPFRIIVLTQRRHWSLHRLLQSVDAADYSTAGPGGVRLEIRVDHGLTADHNRTVDVARRFNFRHGTTEVIELNTTAGLQNAWFEAWMPSSDHERAVILEDDMELSPLWFLWLRRAWDEYGDRTDLGGISLCRQRLRASDGAHHMFQSDVPFLYRIPGSFGFSPHARHWRRFAGWVLSMEDLRTANVDVKGTVTTEWHRNRPDSWEQFWIWWCFRKNRRRKLYTLYVHSRNGALIGHWAEPGVHATEPARINDNPLNETEAVLEQFPKQLEHYGWDFEWEDTSQ